MIDGESGSRSSVLEDGALGENHEVCASAGSFAWGRCVAGIRSPLLFRSEVPSLSPKLFDSSLAAVPEVNYPFE